MSNYKKGITIEFRGETTKLDKALGNIKRNTRDLNTEMKAIDRALKFNPTSVDLWRQKQQVLTQKISETDERLKVLKQAQRDMDTRGVDRNSAEYRDLQREIITTESQLKHFKAQLQQLGNVKLKALSEQFKQIGTKMTDTGKKLTTGITVPIAAVGAASIKAFTEVKDGLNIVAQKTGATGEELKGMQDITRNLAKTIPTDFQSAGTAVGELNTRFGLTGQALEDLSGQYIKFAKVNGVDLNDSIDETQKALAAFGKSAKDAPALLDTLTRAGQLTGASVDDLTSGLIQNATAFQELGLDMNQSVMLMAQLEKSGANSETVMQGLRKALKNAAADGKPLDQALTELQDTILNGKDGMDGLTAAYDLFGKSGDQIYGAVKNGTLDFNALGAAVADTGGTLDSVFAEMLTPAEKFQMTMNSVKDAGYELGNTIMTMLAPYMDKLAQAAQKLSEWWSGLSGNTKKLIVTIAGIAAAVGPVLVVVGKLATGIGAIINVANSAGAALGALGAGAILPIVAGIAAVVAGLVIAYKKSATFRKAVDGLGKSLSKALGPAVKAVIEGVKELVKTFVSLVTTLGNSLAPVIKLLTPIITKMAKVLGTEIKIMVNIAVAVFKVLATVIKTLATVFSTVFTKIVSILTGAWNKIKTIANGIKTALVNPLTAAKNTIGTIVNAIKSHLSFSGISSKVSSAFNAVKSAITSPIQTAKNTLSNILSKIKGMFPLHIGKVFSGLKLPHFKITSFGKFPWGVGGKGKVPSWDVSWYKTGGIFNRPDVIGIGEAGPEAVVPLDTLWSKLDAIANASQGGNTIIINGYDRDPHELAEEVSRILIRDTHRRRLAWQ